MVELSPVVQEVVHARAIVGGADHVAVSRDRSNVRNDGGDPWSLVPTARRRAGLFSEQLRALTHSGLSPARWVIAL